MGHKYIKEEDTFSTSQNGTVPKPTAQEVTDNKVLRADGSWVAQSGGGGGAVTSVNGQTGDVTLDASDVGALPDDTPLFSGSYNDLTDKPSIPSVSADQVLTTGTEIGGVKINNVRTAFYAPRSPQSLDDLTDVSITNPADDDLFTYKNGNWVNDNTIAETIRLLLEGLWNGLMYTFFSTENGVDIVTEDYKNIYIQKEI